MSIFPIPNSTEQLDETSQSNDDPKLLFDQFFAAGKITTSKTVDNYDCCHPYVDITDQIPQWMILENTENETTIFDFTQKYYNWLYCDQACGGSDYLLEDKVLQVIDLEKTKEKYYKKIFYSYFTEYDSADVLKNSQGDIVENDTIARFVKGIKPKFYTKKGSVESLKLFFDKILDEPNPVIRNPKKQLLRLNGGAFYNSNFKFSGGTFARSPDAENIENEIIGSYLNHNRFQDGNIFTDYSYIINSGMSAEDYKGLYTRTVHPSGLNPIFEFDLDSYDPPGITLIEDTLVCSIPKLIRYFPYVLNTNYIDEDFALSISGTTFYGLTYIYGCSLTTNKPSYLFPNWPNSMSEFTRLLDIPLDRMFQLCRINTNINPNSNIPDECP